MARRTRRDPEAEPAGDVLEEVESRRSRRRSSASEDEAPTKQTQAAASGWGAFKEKKEAARSSGDFISGKDDIWKPDEHETLVYFLDDEPFAVYYDVWVPAKKRSYSTLNPENPLSEHLSLKAQPRACFNVLVFDEQGEPHHKVLRCAITLAELVEKMASGPRTSPLSKYYWEMSAVGEGNKYVPTMRNYKPDDLREDWDMDPLTEDELAEFDENLFGPEQVYLYDDAGLMAVVDELSG